MFRVPVFLVSLVMASAMISSVHAQTIESKPTSDDLAAYFGDVVLGQKSGSRILKWTKPPIIRLEVIAASESNFDEAIRVETETTDYEFLKYHVNHLRDLTGLPIRLLPRDIGFGGDITVTIVPWHLVRTTAVKDAPTRLLRQLMGPGRCFFMLWPSAKSGVHKAHIIINSKLDKDHIRHCFLEEITQSLGLPYDSDRVRPSIFNEATKESALSEYDSILIRTLYDPKIVAGMDRSTSIDTAKSIIEKWTMHAD